MPILYLLLLILLAGCREDFSLEADFEDLPVVYAYLDAEDAAHYVRVERTLQAGGGDAGAVAADPGNLYYSAEEATVSLFNATTNRTAMLERVNGEDFGFRREDGPFATSPNVLYRLADDALPLAPGQAVTLTVSRPGEVDAIASTRLLPPLEIVRPTTTARIGDYRRPLTLSWEAEPAVAVFSVEFLFNVQEFDAADPSRDRTVALTYLANGAYRPDGEERSSGQVRFDTDNEAVFRFLGAALTPEDGVVRRLDRFALRITGVGEEVGRLLELRNVNAGLTSSGALPRYSNVSGGQGIVTGRTNDLRTDIQLDDESVDSLREGRYTRALNFR